MKTLPRFSPGFSWPEAKRAGAALSAGRIVRGPGAATFATELAAYLGVKHAFLAPSARMGMWLALRAMGLAPGEIVFPGLTYYAMPAAARLAGFTPRFVDVDAHLLMDVDALEAAINENTRAIAPTHLYGHAVDMDRVGEIAAAHDLPIIEDIAQGLGAKWRGRKVGTFGRLAIATFGPTKNITALGGACLFTDDDLLAERLAHALVAVRPAGPIAVLKALAFAGAMAVASYRPLFAAVLAPLLRLGRRRGVDLITKATDDPPRDFADGVPAWFFQGGIGHLMGEVGRASLAAMDDRNARRRVNGLRLAAALADAPGVLAPGVRDDEEAIFMSFPIRVDDPDAFADALLARGVDTARGYMSACARLPMFASADPTPCADDAEARLLHVPIHPALGDADIDRVAATIRDALAARGDVA